MHWHDIPGFEGLYAVSDAAQVKSLRSGKMVRPFADKDGYPIVACWRSGKRKAFALHRLVAETFLAHQRNALHNEVAHLDGDRRNATVANLKWVSRPENVFHKIAHGTDCRGERHASARLTESAVRHIRSIERGRADLFALAKLYGVSRRTVSSLRNGKGWPHVL